MFLLWEYGCCGSLSVRAWCCACLTSLGVEIVGALTPSANPHWRLDPDALAAVGCAVVASDTVVVVCCLANRAVPLDCGSALAL